MAKTTGSPGHWATPKEHHREKPEASLNDVSRERDVDKLPLAGLRA